MHVLEKYKYIQLQVRENMMLYSFDLDPMTLVLNPDLDMVKIPKKFLAIAVQKPEQTDTQTDTHRDRQTHRICGW